MKFYNKINSDDLKDAVSGTDALLARTDARQTPGTASA